MTIADTFLKEFEVEMAITRRVLERVPEDKLDWNASEKSNTIGWVANHIAEIPGWVEALTQDEWNLNPPGGEPYKTPDLKTRDEILSFFEANVILARNQFAKTPDSEFGRMWSLKSGDETYLHLKKYDVIRTWVLNHTVHHRAYLCSYFRLLGVPVPEIYGPSGDA